MDNERKMEQEELEIHKQLNRLEESISECYKTKNELRKRLTVALSPIESPAAETEPEKDKQKSPLAERIKELEITEREINYELEYMLDNLEL